MKRLLGLLSLGAALFAQPFLFGQGTTVAAAKIVDNTGALLGYGNFCIGTSCFTVTNGAITPKAIVSTIADVSITNGGSTTYLKLPAVTISGAYWNFDNYVVPGSASISGIGTPRIACNPGAVYTQTDGDHNRWVCTGINGVGTWNGVVPPSVGGNGTVTSVGLNMPSIFNVYGSPITGAGTFTATLADAPTNTVLAGPSSGLAGTPSFRKLAVADLPFTYTGNTTTLVTANGTLTQGLALTADANGNIVTAGSGTVIPGTLNAAQVVGLAPSATIDTTNASNITTGTLALARLPATNFNCPSGQVITSFALNAGSPSCIPFQGVVTSGQQYDLPIYTTDGYGTTLGPSPVSVDTSGNIKTAGTIATTNSITAANLSWTGAVTKNQVFASPASADGAPGFRAIVVADLPFTYAGKTTQLATTTGTFTSGHGVVIDADGNLADSGAAVASGTILASVSFTSCAMVHYGDTDLSCTGSQNWPNALLTNQYRLFCTLGLPGYGGGAAAITKTTIGWTGKTTTGFSYFVANDHGGAEGQTVSVDCVAIAQ